MRKAFAWLTPIVAAGVIVAVSVGSAAQASGGLKPLVPGHNARPGHAALVHAKLNDSNLTQSTPFYTTTAGVFNPVDAPTTVTCKATSVTCAIDATMAVELLDQSGQSGNQFAIAVAIDGTVLIGNYTDVAPLDGYFRTYTTVQDFGGFGPGSHTVQTMIYTTYPVFIAYAYSTYHIYKTS
jgi:hypothetical protein